MRIRSVAAAVVLGLLTGCSAGHRVPERSTRASPSASPTTNIVDGERCPEADPVLGLPGEAGCVSSTTGSFEPGEERQTFMAYALLDATGLPTEWHLRVTREAAAPLDERVRIGSEASYPKVLGAEDADAQGLDEVFIKLVTHSYHSGMTHEVGIFGVKGERFFQVIRDGDPLLFQVGGISVFGEGAECRDVDVDGRPEFVLLRIEGVTNDFQNVSERVYRWKDRALVFVRREAGRFSKTGYTDPLLYRYYSLRCFDFEPPAPYARG